MPMVLILSLTGAMYLFKPQIDRWEERAFRNLPTLGAVAPDAQVDAALAVWPGASFHAYRLPEHPGDAAMVHIALPAGEGGQAMRDVLVSPQGQVLATLDPDWRITQVVQKLHGQLLIGNTTGNTLSANEPWLGEGSSLAKASRWVFSQWLYSVWANT